jgi:hypothetical protein
MAKRKFYLLYRNENGQQVWQGDYFRNDEINTALRKGWKVSG